jgi:hypothetical protein
MARVDVALADRVKRYAAVHRQPVSVVIRDALTLLMEEYPSGADLSGSHRLAAHEFLSDRYESPLDTLLGETDSTGLEALLSDTNEAVIDTLLAGPNSEPDSVSNTTVDEAHILSDRKEVQSDIVSDRNTDAPDPRAVAPPHARAQKASDRKAAQSAILSGTKEDASLILSDTKGDERSPLSAIVSDTKADEAAHPPETPAPPILSDRNMPAFDTSKYVLGKLCPRGHDYQGTGQSLLRRANLGCLDCDREKARERRQAKRQAAPA